MKRIVLLLPALMLLAACATTPAERIARHRPEFAGWPAEVQAKVRAGRVAVGFTPAQVRLALGRPDVQRIRATAQGTREVWIYGLGRPRVAIGLGMAAGAGSGVVGAGTMVHTGGARGAGMIRVIFLNGRVSAVEQDIR